MLTFLRKKMKVIMIIVAVVFFGSIFYGLGYMGLKGLPKEGVSQHGLAQVDGKEIDKFRFGQVLNRIMSQIKSRPDPVNSMYLQNIALSQVIDFTIILQEAKKHVSVNNDEIKRAFNDVMQANNIKDEKIFNQLLKAQGFSVSDLKNMIKEEILVQKMINKVKSEVTVSSDDMREIRAWHILIPSAQKDLADKVLAMAKRGEDFSSLAKKFSIDKVSALKGGDLGFFGKGQMVEEFEKSAYALKSNEISPLVKTQFGYHIIKMNESRLKKDANKDSILNQKKENIFNKWFLNLKTKAKIEIKNPIFKAFSSVMKGDFNNAILEYRNAAKDAPSNPYPHIFLGDLLTRIGSREEAVLEFNRASQLGGPDPYVHIYVGEALLKASYLKNAKEEFLKASLVAPENLELHENLAKHFKKLNMKSNYLEEMKKIEKIKEKEKFEEEIRKKDKG